ncbi:hypothetical protein HDU96_004639 [Phlyctochytrium bullatum]|nr:hypothetical protein HDU96_004639 [Phlyctochytrium bullatum]
MQAILSANYIWLAIRQGHYRKAEDEMEKIYLLSQAMTEVEHPPRLQQSDSAKCIAERDNFLKSIENTRPRYPTYVAKNKFGYALCASENLTAGTVVEKFEGPVLETYDDVPMKERCHALMFETEPSVWKWMISYTNARYANHGCAPNAFINSKQELETLVPIEKGKEILFIYNRGEESDEWDQTWSFDCQCGAAHCQGRIDRYRPVDMFGFLNKKD